MKLGSQFNAMSDDFISQKYFMPMMSVCSMGENFHRHVIVCNMLL